MTFLHPDSEVVEAYRSLRQRVIELARSIPEVDSRRTVPSCPDWSVSDVLAHMVGINEDILAGRMDGVTTDAWTQAQVDRHVDEPPARLAEIWNSIAVEFDVLLPHIPTPVNSQLVMDAVTHEHDLRHAIGSTDGRESDAVGVALGWLLDTAEARQPGLGHRLAQSSVPRFQLLRSLTGRRTIRQMDELGLPGEPIASMLAGTPLKPPIIAVEPIS
ncbi:MAG: maleylpyruvate isomerase family mycothiol-dependent enzyme [Acidimicrobiia bacterium]